MASETLNILQSSLRRKDAPSVHEAVKVLLDKNQLYWHHIVNIFFGDYCMSDTNTLKYVFDCYQRGGVQGMFECINMVMTSCNTCSVVQCLAFSAESYLPGYSERLNWENSHPLPESLEGVLDDACGCVDVPLVLSQLLKAWDKEDWRGVIRCIFMTLVVAKLEGKRDVTPKGEDYLLPKSSNVKPHFTLIVLTMLHRATQDQDTKNYILACYNLATIKDVYPDFLLFSIVTRCMNKFKSWKEVAEFSQEEQSMANPEFQKLNGTMRINLKMAIQKYRESDCHGLLGFSGSQYICIPRHKKRKLNERGDEPPAKRFMSDVQGGKVVAKGPYSNPYRMSQTLFSNECLHTVLKDEHAVKVYREGKYIMASCGTYEIRNLHAMTEFRGFPATFWAHLMYKYALRLGDITLPDSVLMDGPVAQSFGIDVLSPKKSCSSLIEVMISTTMKKVTSLRILKAVKKCKFQILALLDEEFNFPEMRALSEVHGVYFDETLFKERIQHCIAMLRVLK